MTKTQNFTVNILTDTKGSAAQSYNISLFSGGEINLKLIKLPFKITNIIGIYIKGNITSSDNIMELMLLKNAIDSCYINLINSKIDYILEIPYVPYGRQDRICNEGEAFGLKIFANLINSMNFDKVITYDNHSDVSTALINNCINTSVKDLLKDFKMDYDYIISPDAGANKKIFEVSQEFNVPFIRADKIRDLKTGSILETVIVSNEDLKDKKVIIIDDICDGGRTFIELGKALESKGVKSIDLYVTHGIFSKGIECLSMFNKIYTKNLFNDEYLNKENIMCI